jgi:hypothetical protein
MAKVKRYVRASEGSVHDRRSSFRLRIFARQRRFPACLVMKGGGKEETTGSLGEHDG